MSYRDPHDPRKKASEKKAYVKYKSSPKGKAWIARANLKRKIKYKENPDHYRAIANKAYQTNKHKRGWERRSLTKDFGLTQAEKWTRLFGDQNGRCANPACSATTHNRKIKWSIHHIHGSDPMCWSVCCARCNWAAGKFEDDPALLRGMADLNENLTPDGYHIPSLVELVETAQSF